MLAGRSLPLMVTGVLATALVAAGAAWVLQSADSPPSNAPSVVESATAQPAAPATSTPAESPRPSPTGPAASRSPTAPRTWPARVDDAPNGIFLYRGPYDSTVDREPVASRWNGNPLRVVCLEPNGRRIRDVTTTASSTVWAELDDGYWIPVMYTTLAEGRPDWSPAIPKCRG